MGGTDSFDIDLFQGLNARLQLFGSQEFQMGSADNGAKFVPPRLVDNVVKNINDSRVRTAQNHDQSPLGAHDEGLVIREDVRNNFPIYLGQEC